MQVPPPSSEYKYPRAARFGEAEQGALPLTPEYFGK